MAPADDGAAPAEAAEAAEAAAAAALERPARRILLRAAAGAAAAGAAALLVAAALAPLALVSPLLYFGAEAVFALLYHQKHAMLSHAPRGLRPVDDYDPEEVFEKTLEHLKMFEDVRAFLSMWFCGAPFESLRRGNVEELLAYAFLYKPPEDAARDGRGPLVARMADRLCAVWGLELPPGYNPGLKFMGHLWDPLSHMWRPLAFYVAMEAAAAAKNAALLAAGFRRRRCGQITYYVRPGDAAGGAAGFGFGGRRRRGGSDGGESGGGGGWVNGWRRCGGGGGGGGEGGGGWSPIGGDGPARSGGGGSGSVDVPMLLLHGVGMGLLPYLGLLANLAATGRTVIAVEFRHVAMRWSSWTPTVDEAAAAVDAVLARERAPRACVVAHSYGTAVASRLLQTRPGRVAHLALCDPVVFACFMPRLLRRFFYDAPATGSALADFAMASAARELHVAASLSRRFFWTDIILWENQIPPGTLVVLSGRDALLAARETALWLEWHAPRVLVMVNPRLAHAQLLVDLPWQRRVIAALLPLQAAALAAGGAAGGGCGGGGEGGGGGGGCGGGEGGGGAAARRLRRLYPARDADGAAVYHGAAANGAASSGSGGSAATAVAAAPGGRASPRGAAALRAPGAAQPPPSRGGRAPPSPEAEPLLPARPRDEPE
ncbi:hypothetical protein Rsub_09678 [Raphidocelis subcapitata]|uniref:AB hydrolase-1 domain-containing protein n=1 Tax=Raphidocelis subcapitata TaxID=307507 RepID=A0A2V0PCZ1_9CHLO|nr:hypothetical protein Rsub_09678 [Raphidocelis subcapitata]|eukprot:GBF96822.1 hypothetical protein Rsub_09678 [Raphidocelis subcapitata]